MAPAAWSVLAGKAAFGAKAGPDAAAGGVLSESPARTPSMETDPFPPLLPSGLAPNPAELTPAAGAMLGAEIGPTALEVPLLPPEPLPLS